MIQAFLHSLIPWIDITALAALIGASLCLLYTAESNGKSAEYPKVFLNRVRRLIAICLSLLTISSVFGLIGRGMEMSGFGFGASLPLLPTVVFKSHYGSMWLLRVAGLIIAWIVLIAGRRYTGSRLFGGFLLLAGALLAFSRSASGHPSDFGDLSPQQLADWLHLLAVSAWGGYLMALAAIIPPAFVKDDILQQRLAAITAERLYLVFGPLLSIIVFTGLYNAWFQIGSFQALTTTPYGGLFSVKILLLLVLALRYIAPPEHGRDEALFATKFLSRTRKEAVIFSVLLLCVALLVHQIPARHFLHLQHMRASGGSTSGPMHEDQMHQHKEVPWPAVTLDTKPDTVIAGKPAAMTVRIKAPDGSPFRGIAFMHQRILHAVIISKDLDFFAHIHPEDSGPVTTDMITKASFPLLFTFPRAGDYLIGLDFATDDSFYSRTFHLHVAKAPEMGVTRIDFSTQKDFEGYKVTLRVTPEEIHSGEDTTLRYIIENNGKPVTDLEPFLGASMHLAVVSEDLKVFIHSHGTVPGSPHDHHDHMHAPPPPEKFGPEIEADVVFPAKGVYKIYSQVEHQGKVLLFDFMVKVQ
jgi:copper resistance protein D